MGVGEVTHRKACTTPGGGQSAIQVIEGYIQNLQTGEGLCLAAPLRRQGPIQQVVCQIEGA